MSKIFLRYLRPRDQEEDYVDDEAAEHQSRPSRNPAAQRDGIIVEGLSFSICDSMTASGDKKWFHASAVLGRGLTLFEPSTLARVDECWRSFVLSRVLGTDFDTERNDPTEYMGLGLEKPSKFDSANLIVGGEVETLVGIFRGGGKRVGWGAVSVLHFGVCMRACVMGLLVSLSIAATHPCPFIFN